LLTASALGTNLPSRTTGRPLRHDKEITMATTPESFVDALNATFGKQMRLRQ
jgi:hypothetical protein